MSTRRALTTPLARASDKSCPVCLQLCVKPSPLPCGHVACLFCTHCAMSATGDSRCALCRAAFTALPALSRALENHACWCDVAAFAKRLREGREEEKEKGMKSPRFEALSVERARDALEATMTTVDANEEETSVRKPPKFRVVGFGSTALNGMDDDETVASALERALEEDEETAKSDAVSGEISAFDPSSGAEMAVFHACGCGGGERWCGELATRPVCCQQCGTLYEEAHAKMLVSGARGGDWCVECGAWREPTSVIFTMKDDIEAVYPEEVVRESRERCDAELKRHLENLSSAQTAEDAKDTNAEDAALKVVDATTATTTTMDEEEDRDTESDDGEGKNAENDGDSSDDSHPSVRVGDGGVIVFEPSTFVHYGVGCDWCGLYPIVGPRYQCEECSESEFMGFDLCSKCMQNVFEHPERKRDYRFAQNHTDAHKMRLVQPRPTMIHVMKSLHPELSEEQIMNWLEAQARAQREAAAEALAAAANEEIDDELAADDASEEAAEEAEPEAEEETFQDAEESLP